MDRKILLNVLQKCGFYLHNQKGKKLGQYRILGILKKEGAIPQQELQKHLRVKSGSISEILLKMEKAGLILRTRSCEDKRRVLVDVTEEGLSKLNFLVQEYERENEHLFNSLSEEECKSLYEMLMKLYTAWTGEVLC